MESTSGAGGDLEPQQDLDPTIDPRTELRENGFGAIFQNPKHFRSDCKMFLRILSLGCIPEATVEKMLLNVASIAAGKAKGVTSKREVIAALKTLIAAGKIRAEVELKVREIMGEHEPGESGPTKQELHLHQHNHEAPKKGSQQSNMESTPVLFDGREPTLQEAMELVRKRRAENSGKAE